ncbi:MICOS complex subunit MIC27-like [Carlito syrichta]|uniref:MICOS complex subunit n=1 Tax=Carlito syrichta TaxID=1868482 RepID=A0A3Q0EBT8_CARSF|nr:MICOS complex subunit MIC27-like [Carlito syrichta]
MAAVRRFFNLLSPQSPAVVGLYRGTVQTRKRLSEDGRPGTSSSRRLALVKNLEVLGMEAADVYARNETHCNSPFFEEEGITQRGPHWAPSYFAVENGCDTSKISESPPELIRKWKVGSFSIKKVFLIYLSQMGKLTTMPVSLIHASINVSGVKEEESKKQLVKPEQLPLYTAPPLQSKYVEEQPGHLQMGFASIRTASGHYIGWCKGFYAFMKNGIMDSVQFGKDAYVYLKNPPRDFLPKMGVITVSGLAGLVSARKGSRFKKITYPLGLATFGATVCYPVQSVIIAKVSSF